MSAARHTICFAALVAVVIAALGLFAPSMSTQLLALAPLVAVLGLPHGALDFEVARALYPLPTAKTAARFSAIYLGASAATLALWLMAPGLALAAFLAYSVLHFSDDWTASAGRRASVAGALLAVALPVAANPGEVANLFALLVPEAAARLVANGAGVMGWIAIPFALALGRHQSTAVQAEWVALAASAIVLPPLVHFAVYFCGLHSPRHFRSITTLLGLSTAAGLRAAILPTVATLLACAVAAALILANDVEVDTTVMRLVFVTLACLTVPHMLLVDRLTGRYSAGQTGCRTQGPPG